MTLRLPTRVAAIGVAALVLTVSVVGLLTYRLVRVSSRRDVDRFLRRELATVVSGFPALLAAQPEPAPDALARAARQFLALHPGSDRHMTVFRVGNDSFSTRAAPEPLRALQEDGDLPEGRPGRLMTVGSDEGPVRVLNASLGTGGGTPSVGTVTILASLGEARDDANDSLARVAVAGAAGLVLGGTALVVSTRRALRPVGQLAEAARATGGGDLDRRVPAPARRDELGVLAEEFNRMLDRLSADAEQRRRLLAAVSHELRTPLAVARGHLEVFEGQAGGPGAAAEVAAVIRAELDRLGRLVDDLSAVAHEGGPSAVEVGATFVPDVLDDLRQRLAGLGLAGISIGEAPTVVIEADQSRLGQALLNLVTNAVAHTPAGTPVRVTAAPDGARWVAFRVSDDGPGVDAAVRERMFEPFVTTRADGSGRGSGLGLAVVRTLTEAQGGTVEVDTGPAGTTVTLRLPAAG